jgi:isopropylmalate/homocitrate/citramalate synthase
MGCRRQRGGMPRAFRLDGNHIAAVLGGVTVSAGSFFSLGIEERTGGFVILVMAFSALGAYSLHVPLMEGAIETYRLARRNVLCSTSVTVAADRRP